MRVCRIICQSTCAYSPTANPLIFWNSWLCICSPVLLPGDEDYLCIPYLFDNAAQHVLVSYLHVRESFCLVA